MEKQVIEARTRGALGFDPIASNSAESYSPKALVDLTTKTVTIIIPAYNEGEVIADVVRGVRTRLGDRIESLIVVDDGSTDDTAARATAAGATVLKHPENRGYGAALKTGIRAARSAYVLFMDADGQHAVEDVERLCHKMIDDAPCDMVVGERTQRFHSPLWRMPGKWFLTQLAQYLVQRSIPDLNSGLRIVKRETLAKYMRLCPQGFSFSTTITMALLSRGYAVRYEPIEVKKRVGKSTVRVSTGFQTVLLVLRLASLFNPLRVFLPASLVSVAAGVVWGVPYVLKGEGVTVGSMLAVVAGILLFALGLMSDQIAQLRLERYE